MKNRRRSRPRALLRRGKWARIRKASCAVSLACAAFLAFLGTGLSSAAPSSSSERLSFSLARVEDRTGDFPIVGYSFLAGERRFLFCPPSQWKITGDASEMTFSADDHGDPAKAVFHVASTEDLAAVGPDSDEKKLAALVARLPVGYTDLHVIAPPHPDSIAIHNFQSLEAEFQYNFFGRDLKSSVLICKMGETIGYTALVTASAKSYDAFIAPYHSLLTSFQLIPNEAVNGKAPPAAPEPTPAPVPTAAK